MNKKTCDVLIIGGGPAGSSAAFTLSNKGLDVCLIDRAVFPRQKCCGGLLTLRCKKVFETVFRTSWDPVVDVTSGSMLFYHNSRLLNSVSSDKRIHFTSRYQFDNYLLNLARQSGVKLELGSGVRWIDIKNCEVELFNGKSLKAEYVIGADGVTSKVAKSLFGNPLPKKTLALGIEMEAPISDRLPAVHDPEIHFDAARWGYGWVFPKQSTVTLGIAGILRKNQNLKEKFYRFLAARFNCPPSGAIRGHYIPFGGYMPKPGCRNILLCGDAAGLVDPITGEGIAFAIQSGYWAAYAILQASSMGEPSRACYFYQKKYAGITNELNRANRLRWLIFPAISKRLFVNCFSKSKGGPGRYFDLLAGEIDYRDFELFLMKKVKRLILSRIGYHPE